MIRREAEAPPALLDPVTVWLLSPILVGVPETDPSDPIAIPCGSDGSESQCPGRPPVNNGVSK